MFPLLLSLILAPAYHPDAYIICGPKPLEVCLVTVDQCLRESLNLGAEPDLAFEWCAEEVDPTIVHFGEVRP